MRNIRISADGGRHDRQSIISVSGGCLILAALASAAPQLPPPQQPPIQVGAEEVVLDVVVRDKKGKLVRELGPADFEVSDNGAKQTIRSVRLVEGKEAIAKTGTTPLDPLRQIRLVTLVFERLDPEEAPVRAAGCTGSAARLPTPECFLCGHDN